MLQVESTLIDVCCYLHHPICDIYYTSQEELLVLKLKWEEHEALKLENETLKTATQDLEVKAASHERTAAHLRNEKLSLGTLVDGLRLEIEKQKLKNVQLMSNEVIGSP